MRRGSDGKDGKHIVERPVGRRDGEQVKEERGETADEWEEFMEECKKEGERVIEVRAGEGGVRKEGWREREGGRNKM